MEPEDLEPSDKVLFQFLRQQHERCQAIAPDERFKVYMKALEQSYNKTTVQSYLYMLLTLISMPSYVNMYKFLIDANKHALQKIYEEQDLHARIEQTNEVFSNFVSKLELWNKLEHNYDFKQDQAKT